MIFILLIALCWVFPPFGAVLVIGYGAVLIVGFIERLICRTEFRGKT